MSGAQTATAPLFTWPSWRRLTSKYLLLLQWRLRRLDTPILLRNKYFVICASSLLIYLLCPDSHQSAVDPWNIWSADDVKSGAACTDFGIRAPFPFSVYRTYEVGLDDVFIAIKTTYKNQNRLDLIHQTWLKYSSSETFIVTDIATDRMRKQFGDKVIESDCHHSYKGKGGLQCKTKTELLKFIHSSKNKWFCNLDDDMYLNMPRLIQLLHCFDPDQEWYIGSKTIPYYYFPLADGVHRKFEFAQGQIYCLTRKVVIRIMTIFGNVPFNNLNALSDDKVIGYINDLTMNNKLTYVKSIYHHGNNLKELQDGHLPYVVSFSYCFKRNVFINVTGFPIIDDPTRWVFVAHMSGLKEQVYSTNPKTLEEFEGRIRVVMVSSPKEFLVKPVGAVPSPLGKNWWRMLKTESHHLISQETLSGWKP